MQYGELPKGKIDGSKFKVSILAPHFNNKLVMELLENTQNELYENDVKKENIKIIRVTGALELPLTAKIEALKNAPDVIIALGVVIKGTTDHYDMVNHASHNGLMQVQLETQIPIIFGVLSCRTPEQAIQRVRGSAINKGAEFARTALFQATINQQL